MPTAEEIYSVAAAEGALPDPLLTVSEWADQYRTLSQRASAEPGPWRTDRTPYLREIMDWLSPARGRSRGGRCSLSRLPRSPVAAGLKRRSRTATNVFTGYRAPPVRS